ncbi:MAG: V-type ATP synthase subunit D [Nitrospiraceae bacterium]|nr:MAG: V-type ATP synthase subunit D [Nitrospiraceae bacterium]
MIHPTRTNLLMLRERAQSVGNSIGILKARRQALIQEFLNTARPFLQSREAIRNTYGKAIDSLSLSLGHEGKDTVESVASAAGRDIGVNVTYRNLWGLKYKDLIVHDKIRRMPDKRGYDFLSTTSRLEESIGLFEKTVESMLEIAAFENKLKILGEEIIRILRKIRVLEERVLPGLRHQIKTISQYIGERDRENIYRLKKFKGV